MHKSIKITGFIACAATISVVSATNAKAEDFPSQPITAIVAFSPGGGNDTVVRLMAEHIEPYLGTRMVVENLPGASGQVGWTRLAQESNDGYTIGMISSPSIFLVELLRDDVAFTLDDFDAITNVQSDPIVLMVNADSEYEDFEVLADAIMADPGAMNVGGDGPQSNVHLQAAAFEDVLGLDINFVSYEGSGPAAEALLGNEVAAAFLTTSASMPFIEAGRLVPLAMMAPERHPSLPDVPTISEVAGEEVPAVGTAIRGMIAPAGVPEDRLAHLEDAFRQLLEDDAFNEAALNMGIVTTYQGAEEFGDLLNSLRADTENYIDLME